jgi:hypothetical protein
MKCPKCGAENPESAEYCSLCMEKLLSDGATAPRRKASTAPGDTYHAPGEWRGDAETLRPEVSRIVVEKVRRYRVRLAIYGVIIAMIIIWLVLSFTVWGNPSPGDRSMQLIDAVNARNEEAFLDLFQEQNRAAAGELYDRVTSFLGSTGSYDVKLDVDKQNNYEAVSYLASGTIVIGGGSTRDVSRSDNLRIVMENRKGRWYIVPLGTDIIP